MKNRKGLIVSLALVLTLAFSAVSFGQTTANYKSEEGIKLVRTAKSNKKVKKDLTRKQALNILKKIDNRVPYIYIGSEKDFDALLNKKLKGYVFLPDEEGDMGYFVNKKNKRVYYFHPSGYMERIKY